MNNNINQPKKSRLKEAFGRFFGAKASEVTRPYYPEPNQASNTSPSPENIYSETEADVSQLHGTNLKFGSQTSVEIDKDGRAKAVTLKPSYILGSGRRISSIDEIGGVCRYCQQLALQAFNKGELTAEQAQIQSLFDTKSQRQCEICGIFTCNLHTSPFRTPEGAVNICQGCREQIDKQLKRKKIINLLLSPFFAERNQ